MWESDSKESWALKNWCFWTVVLEKTLESPLDCKEIKPVYPKGIQSRIFRIIILEKEMTTYSSTPAWKISWMEVPGGLQSMGPQRVGHDWATSLHEGDALSFLVHHIIRYVISICPITSKVHFNHLIKFTLTIWFNHLFAKSIHYNITTFSL